jgi:paraquat-inducible protein B
VGKKTSTTAIGAFVIGAIALTVASVIVFGSGKLFATTVPCVFYFTGTVQGLSIGSPVKFRGVQIGEVTEIKMILNQNNMDVDIPVYAVLYPERIILGKGQKYKSSLQPAIDAGARGQLQMQSLITGQLFIALDFHPDAPPAKLQGDGTVTEIPTIPTVVEQLAEMIKKIKFDELLASFTRTADGIEKLVNDPDIEEGIDNFKDTMKEIELLVRNVNGQVDPLSEELQKTLAAATETAVAMEKTLANSAAITSDGSPLMHELLQAINELKEAGRSMGALADFLERHPESIIFGKGGSQ